MGQEAQSPEKQLSEGEDPDPRPSVVHLAIMVKDGLWLKPVDETFGEVFKFKRVAKASGAAGRIVASETTTLPPEDSIGETAH